jgi:hypothetical protein
VQIKPDSYYQMLVAVNGTTVTVTVNGTTAFTHTFAPRVLDGVAFGLNKGLVGVGSDNARGTFDNVSVQVLPRRSRSTRRRTSQTASPSSSPAAGP